MSLLSKCFSKQNRMRMFYALIVGIFYVYPVLSVIIEVISHIIEQGFNWKFVELIIPAALFTWLLTSFFWWLTFNKSGDEAKIREGKVRMVTNNIVQDELSKIYENVSILNPKNIFQNSAYLSHRFDTDPVMSVHYDKFFSAEFMQETLSYGREEDRVTIGDFYTFEHNNQSYTLFELKENKSAMAVLISPVDHDFQGFTLACKHYFSSEYPLPDGFEKVELESEDFMSKFRVYTTSQVDARICLKTNVMTAWEKYTRSHNINTFIEFGKNKVMIGIQIKPELFAADREGNVTKQNLDKSMQLLAHMIELTQLLNINHEYLYKS